MRFKVNPNFIATRADIGEFTVDIVNGGYVLRSKHFKQLLKRSEYESILRMDDKKPVEPVIEDAVIVNKKVTRGPRKKKDAEEKAVTDNQNSSTDADGMEI